MNLMEIVAGKQDDKAGFSSQRLVLAGIRAGMRALGTAAPAIAAHLAERLWFMPPRPRIPPLAREALQKGQAIKLKVRGRDVACWKWGKGPPVLLIHGWGGYAGQMVPFVAPLLEAGFSAVAIDAPGHGDSAEGRLGYRQVSFVDFAEAIAAAVETIGPVHAVVAHSGGCAAAAKALHFGLRVEGVVFCAPMTRPAEYADVYGQALGLGANVMQRWKAHAEERVGFRWNEIDIRFVGRLPGAPPALVVHDRDDREIPCIEGDLLAEAWPRVALHSTRGLGHRRLLRDPSVIARVTEFLMGLAPASGPTIADNHTQ